MSVLHKPREIAETMQQQPASHLPIILQLHADLPTLTHCAWDSRICVLFPPTIAILTHKIRCKVRIFLCTTVYFPYILRKLPISRIIIANSRIDSQHITHLTQNRLACLLHVLCACIISKSMASTGNKFVSYTPACAISDDKYHALSKTRHRACRGVITFISKLTQRSKDFPCVYSVYTPHRGVKIINLVRG